MAALSKAENEVLNIGNGASPVLKNWLRLY